MSLDYILGTETGTGAAISVDIGFTPSKVEYQISEAGLFGYWESTMRDGTGVIEMCNELRAGNILLGRHTPQIGSTDTALANLRVCTQHDAAGDVREDQPAVLAGTAFTATNHDIDAAEWALYLLCSETGGATITIIRSGSTWGAVGGYASEALAIAAMPTKTTDSAILGYITIEATAGAIFNASTDALAGGASGTAAATTNYYEGYGIMENGITPKGLSSGDTIRGFTIGTDALLNFLGGSIEYKAYR